MRERRKGLWTALAATILSAATAVNSQEPEKIIRAIFDEALTDNTAWRNLEHLCKKTPGRLPGSPAASSAAEFTKQALISAGADTVWLQKVNVPNWERGREKCTIRSAEHGTEELTVSALGLSVGTSGKGIRSGVVEVKTLGELALLGREKIENKIVFFNRPADNRLINSFAGYGSAVDQRIGGASEAAKYGAAAVIVRSATQAIHDFPHTGVVRYQEEVRQIPALAVSTVDADLLSLRLRSDPALSMHIISTCRNLPDTWSCNVIGEIRGATKPEEIITVGGHLDSWDTGEGAHDDAGGCVQSIETLRLFRETGIKPKRTIRAVMFMNEEMTGTGGRVYASEAAASGEIHYAALESDRGVTSPRGFGFDAEGSRLEKLQALSSYFEPYNIRDFDRGGGGSDIGHLKPLGTLLIGYMPDTQRYFWYHHSGNDTLEQVNVRELQMGSAAIASLIFLIDLLDL